MSLIDDIRSCAKNHTFYITRHFSDDCAFREDEVVPDIEGIHNLMATQTPVHIEKGTNDTYMLYYSINLRYDLIIVISWNNFYPEQIKLITRYPKLTKRRPGK